MTRTSNRARRKRHRGDFAAGSSEGIPTTRTPWTPPPRSGEEPENVQVQPPDHLAPPTGYFEDMRAGIWYMVHSQQALIRHSLGIATTWPAPPAWCWDPHYFPVGAPHPPPPFPYVRGPQPPPPARQHVTIGVVAEPEETGAKTEEGNEGAKTEEGNEET